MRRGDEERVETTKRVFLFFLVAGTISLVWALWTLWLSPEGGARTATEAKTYFLKGMCTGLTIATATAWQRRRTRPDSPGMRRLFGQVAATALAWAAVLMRRPCVHAGTGCARTG